MTVRRSERVSGIGVDAMWSEKMYRERGKLWEER